MARPPPSFGQGSTAPYGLAGSVEASTTAGGPSSPSACGLAQRRAAARARRAERTASRPARPRSSRAGCVPPPPGRAAPDRRVAKPPATFSASTACAREHAVAREQLLRERLGALGGGRRRSAARARDQAPAARARRRRRAARAERARAAGARRGPDARTEERAQGLGHVVRDLARPDEVPQRVEHRLRQAAPATPPAAPRRSWRRAVARCARSRWCRSSCGGSAGGACSRRRLSARYRVDPAVALAERLHAHPHHLARARRAGRGPAGRYAGSARRQHVASPARDAGKAAPWSCSTTSSRASGPRRACAAAPGRSHPVPVEPGSAPAPRAPRARPACAGARANGGAASPARRRRTTRGRARPGGTRPRARGPARPDAAARPRPAHSPMPNRRAASAAANGPCVRA